MMDRFLHGILAETKNNYSPRPGGEDCDSDFDVWRVWRELRAEDRRVGDLLQPVSEVSEEAGGAGEAESEAGVTLERSLA